DVLAAGRVVTGAEGRERERQGAAGVSRVRVEQLLRLHRVVRRLQDVGVVIGRRLPEDGIHRVDDAVVDHPGEVGAVYRHLDRLTGADVVERRLAQVEIDQGAAIQDTRSGNLPGRLQLSGRGRGDRLQQVPAAGDHGVGPLALVEDELEDELVDIGAGRVPVRRVPHERHLTVTDPALQPEGAGSDRGT